MNGGSTLTAPFVRHSWNTLVICDVRGWLTTVLWCRRSSEQPCDGDVTNQGSAVEWYRTYCVHGCRSAAWALVGLGQSNGSDNGGHKEGGAGQDHWASRPEHLPTIQGLDWPEGPHHRLSIVELELRELTQLREHNTSTNVRLQFLEKDHQQVEFIWLCKCIVFVWTCTLRKSEI